MNLKTRPWIVSLALVGILVLSACGGSNGGTSGGTTGGSGGKGLTVSTAGEQLMFDPATLTVKSGEQVTITFKNGSASQQHNWVLAKGGDEVAGKVDEAGLAAGASNNYIPSDKSNVIASSKLLNGGESETITFTAPAAGSYTYLCTVPGHYAAGMKGTLVVQ